MKSLSAPAAIAIWFFLIFQQTSLTKSQECPPDLNLPEFLSDKVVPKAYTVALKFNLEANTLSGLMLINIDINQTISVPEAFDSYIYLDVFPDLTIHADWTRLQKNGVQVDIKDQCRDSINGYWVIELPLPYQKGNYSLQMGFTGTIEEREDIWNGLYNYDDSHGQRRQFVMESSDSLFPLFSNVFMSSYNLKIKHQKKLGNINYRTLCSLEAETVILEEDNKEWFVTTCRTPEGIPCASDSVAIHINSYIAKSKKDSDFKHSVWTIPELADATDYALSIGFKTVQFYNKLTRLEYPFKKLDSVAFLHKETTSGAILYGESLWSMIHFKETAVLWREGELTVDDKFTLADTFCHEMAHAWFGHRITVRNDRDVWLEEAFCEWMKYKAIDFIEPSWHILDEHILQTVEAMAWDSQTEKSAVNQSTAVTFPLVRNIEWFESNDVFFPIDYVKGRAVLHMIERHIGMRRFKRGMHYFLKQFKGQTVVTDDLLNSLQSNVSIAEINIVAVFGDWIRKPGFPCIKVMRKWNEVWLEQNRLFQDGERGENFIWQIPIRYYQDGGSRTFLMTKRVQAIENVTSKCLLKFNIEHLGYYVTWYHNWTYLIDYMKRYPLGVQDTAGIIRDIYFLTDVRKVDYAEVIGLVGRILNGSHNVVVWQMGQKLIDNVYSFMKIDPTNRERLANLVIPWLENKYNSDLWNETNKSANEIRFAVTIIQLACMLEKQRCLADAKAKFDDWRSDPDRKLPPNIRKLVYCYGLKNSDSGEDFDFVVKQIQSVEDSPLVSFSDELKDALSCVSNMGLVYRYLNYVFSESKTTHVDLVRFMKNIAKNPVAVTEAWERFRKEFNSLRTSQASQPISNGELAGLTVHFAQQFAGEGTKKLISDMLVGSGLQKALIAIDKNTSLVAKHRQAFIPSNN